MKAILFLICFFLSLSAHNQSVYTSSFTQTWPTIFNSRVEEVKKTISFEENAIILSTALQSGKEIETFYIKKIKEADGATEYYCLTRDNQRITVTKPYRQLMYIDLYQISERTGEEVQFRLHLD